MVTRPLCSPPCWRVRRLLRWAWERVGRGNCCYVAVCSAAQGASALTGGRGAGAYRGGRPPTAVTVRHIINACSHWAKSPAVVTRPTKYTLVLHGCGNGNITAVAAGFRRVWGWIAATAPRGCGDVAAHGNTAVIWTVSWVRYVYLSVLTPDYITWPKTRLSLRNRTTNSRNMQ